MLRTKRASLHCTELYVYFLSSCGYSRMFRSKIKPAFPLKAMLGCEGCVSALLEHGASALYRDSQGRTPLHLAASRGHTELLRTLLKAAMKSDPLDSMLDYRGYMPVHWAAYHGEILRPEFLYKDRHGTTLGCLVTVVTSSLLTICLLCEGHEDCVHILLEKKLFNYQEGNLFTPLHCAL